jgi:hypothetical protein
VGFQTATRLDGSRSRGPPTVLRLGGKLDLKLRLCLLHCTPLKVLFDDRLDNMPSMAISKNLDHAPEKLCRIDDHKLADRLAVAEALPVAASEG